MSKQKFDVSKIREEVESRKKQQNDHAERTGQPTSAPVSSMSFLRSLKESVITGNASSAVINKVKMVEQKAEQKKPTGLKSSGARSQTLDDSLSAHITSAPSNVGYPQQRQQLDEDYEVGGREAAMYRKMQEENQRLLGRTGGMSAPAPVDALVNEYYGNKPTAAPMQVGNGLILNEKAINEEIDRKFNNYINDSVNPIMEAAMKNTIIEIYSRERVKKALLEIDLTKMVKEIVMETIKELQQRNKNNKA